MIRQTTPNTNVPAYIAAVVAERVNGRNADLFNAFQADWQKLCVDYIVKMGSPLQLQPHAPMTELLKIALRNLYHDNEPKRAQFKAISDLRNHRLRICPACGDLHNPSTLDHFLPQEKYPEFAILPENLSPMCDVCQGKKLSKSVDASGLQMFLHPYYDVSRLGNKILKLSVSPPYNAPALSVVGPDPGVPTAMLPLVERHIAYLDLQNRFNQYFSGEYIRLLRNVSHIRQVGLPLREQLSAFRFNASLSSENSWDCLLYDECLSNAPLFSYLQTETLPTNL